MARADSRRASKQVGEGREQSMNVGILTGGGDCPGLNAVIRAVVRRGTEGYGMDVLGIRNGWEGLITGQVEPLTPYFVTGILPRGGTILGTSRTNPCKDKELPLRVRENYKKYALDAVVVVGGEDTLGVAVKLGKIGLNCVGVPKTIDNDIGGTDVTFGFDTAVTIATEAIDRLHSTAESHHRIMVVEVMGRHAGWIALHAGIAGGADAILVPEVPFSVKDVWNKLSKRHAKGKTFSIVVVAEGATAEERSELIKQDDQLDEFGHVRLGGIGHWLGKEIERVSGIETRVTILGHVQRGGSPTPFDRVLATRFGVRAVDAVAKSEWGKMVALQGSKIGLVDIAEAIKEIRKVDSELYEIASVFYG
jgi:phosphofructokinase-like protein